MATNPKCATCPKLLTDTDVKRRCLRCKPCRFAKRVTPASRIVINPQKAAMREGFIPTPPPESKSWWMRPDLTRASFQAEAQRRSDEQKQRFGSKFVSTSPNGVTT